MQGDGAERTSARPGWKDWLKHRTQSLLGTKGLHEQLTRIEDRLRVLADAAQERQPVAGPVPAAAEPASAPADRESFRQLERQGLFILGCARSGTTILSRSLNRSPDVLLLEEPNCFLHEHVADFVTYFNSLHKSMGNRCLKGTYLPPPVVPETGPMATLLRLCRDYRFVGEKAALGPHDYPGGWAQAYLDFQGKYFFRGRYIYILRRPAEVVWSMHKMFPDRPVSRLFETWLAALALSLDAYHVFPESRLVFFDDLGDEMIERLGDWLDVPIPIVPGTFGDRYKYSALQGQRIPAPLQPFAELCRECTSFYDELRESFSHEEYVYRGSTTEWAYFSGLLGRVQTGIDQLRSETAETRGLRLAA